MKKHYLFPAIKLICIISLLTSGLSHPHTSNISYASSAEKGIEDQITDLKSSFFGQNSSRSANLDPFMLIKQFVKDDRREFIEEAIEKTYLDNLKEKTDYLNGKKSELLVLADEVSEKLRNTTEPSKIEDINRVLYDINSRVKVIEIELADLDKLDPSNENKLDLAHMVDTELSTRHYWGKKLVLKTFDEDGNELQNIRQNDFTESLSPKNNLDGTKEKASTFSLFHPKTGVELNTFEIPTRNIIFYGQYIIFTQNNATDEKPALRFIDLDYFKTNIGNAPLPIYTLPLKEEQSGNLSIKDGKLVVGGQILSYEQFHLVAETHHALFNVAVSIIDGDTYNKAQALTESIYDLYSKSMNNQSLLFQEQFGAAINLDSYLNTQVQELKDQKNINSPTEAKKIVETALKDGLVSDSEAKIMSDKILERENLTLSNQARATGNKLFTRIRLLLQKISHPRPEGSVKLQNALLITLTGTKDQRAEILNQKSKLIKFLKFGGLATGSILAGMALPEPYTLHLQQGLDFISAFYDHFQGYLQHIDYGKNYAILSKDAFVTSTSGITYFFESYLSDGKWSSFIYGLGSLLLIPLKLFAAIHITINSGNAIWKTHQEYRNNPDKLSLIKSFTSWADKDNRNYWKRKSESERESQGADINTELSDEEALVLFEHLERLKSNQDNINSVKRNIKNLDHKSQSLLSGYLAAIKDFRLKESFYRAIGKKADSSSKETNVVKTKENFLEGLSHTFLSYSSLSNTFGFNARLWNFLYIPRSLWYLPKVYIMAAVYPNFIKVAAMDPSGKQKYPSIYNSGTSGWYAKLTNALSSKKNLKNIEGYEDALSKIENAVMRLSIEQSQQALIKKINDPKRLLAILNASEIGETQKSPSIGITSLHDKKINALTKKERTFFRLYFSRYYELSMKSFVSDLLKDKNHSLNPDQFAKSFTKNIRSGNIDPKSLNIDENQISQLLDNAKKSIKKPEISLFAEKASRSILSVGQRVKTNFKHDLLMRLHPNHPQIRRKMIVDNQLQKPKAMDRAVRMEVASLFTSIPVGILSSLVLYAGVQSGLIMPFDPNGLDTDTHLNYMSRYLFYNGFVPGLIIGLLANTWMKVQMDFRLDSKSGFNKTILQKDSKKGFWRYYLKNLIKNPENKWKDNHLFYLKLIYANFPAAALTIIGSNLYGLGRVDLDSFIVSYMVIFTTFLTGFGLKIDQAFELSTQWISEKIPRKLRSHPNALKYIDKKSQSKKMTFSLLENVWGIVVTENITGTMLTLKENAQMGTRAFVRMLFGGETPTALVQSLSEKVSTAFYKIPGMDNAIESINQIFTNNYEAFERYPEYLLDQPADFRVVEDPNLPKNIPAEILGKLTAAIGTVGAYTSLPYIYAYYKDKLSQHFVQKKGIQHRDSKNNGALSCKSLL